MTLDLGQLGSNLDLVENIEKATLRMVVQAIYDFRREALTIVANEQDLVQDVGEDITREALDRLGVSRIPERLFGKVDYKVARYVFLSDFSIRQALFVDSKAEDVGGSSAARVQVGQTSMRIRQLRAGIVRDEVGVLPAVLRKDGEQFLTTTVFVKYNYGTYLEGTEQRKRLISITVAALPNGLLQDRYNPDHLDTIWRAGPDAPSLGEAFRVRLSFSRLQAKAQWRVQRIALWPSESFGWVD